MVIAVVVAVTTGCPRQRQPDVAELQERVNQAIKIELEKVRARGQLTAAEIEQAKHAMPVEEFWRLMEAASNNPNDDCLKKAESLKRTLALLPQEAVIGFEIRFSERLIESYRNELWAVADIVNGGASEDGFLYFCCWLISHGEDYFKTALRDPVRAADRATKKQRNECEQLLSVGQEAYRLKVGREMALFTLPNQPDAGAGMWDNVSPEKLYPELAKRFR